MSFTPGIPDWSNPKVTDPVIYDGHRFTNPEGAGRYRDKMELRNRRELDARNQDFNQLRLLGERMSMARAQMQMRQQAEYDRRARFQQQLDLMRSRAAGYRIDPTALPNNRRDLMSQLGY